MAIRQNPRIRPMKPWILAARAVQLASGHGHENRVGGSAPPPTVEVAEVLQSDIQVHRQCVATLEGFVNAEIRPQVEGYVRKQAYRDGAYVQRGDVLFLIDPRNYQAALDLAKSTLARNIAALGKARLDVKRDRELIAGQFIPQQQ